MEITLLGTGSAWPDADRNGQAFLLQNNEKNFLIDCGGGVSHQLMKVGTPPSKLDYILFSHVHIDHCVEFPSLVFGSYLTGKEGSFKVFGPKGTKHFTTSIFADTYNFAQPMLQKLRNKNIEIDTIEVDGGEFLKVDDLNIETIRVEHDLPTLAYKFSTGGKSVVFSGDTAYCQNIIDFSKDADVLVIECSFPEHLGKKPGHCIPSEVGSIARKANVKSVILTHLFPNCKGHEEDMVAEIKKVYSGSVQVGHDLMKIDL